MKQPRFVTSAQAVKQIADGSTVCVTGMTVAAVAEEVLFEIEKSFLKSGGPKGLTLVHTCGMSDRKGGIQRLAHEGLVSRVIGGHWGMSPGMMQLISDEKIEAYNMPQGQMANLFHSMAMREPGKLSKVGLGTFIDPRQDGGRMNERTKKLPHMIDVLTIDGEEYLRYRPIPIDTLIIRGTYCDEYGNLSMEREGISIEVFPAVMATKRFGGQVICQVEQVVRGNTINPLQVEVPGVFIDTVAVCQNPAEFHRQSSSWYYDPVYSGHAFAPLASGEPLPLNERKVIGRRAAMFLKPQAVINVGIGIPNDVMGPLLNEEGLQQEITITVESGVYGGVPAGGPDFGVAKNAMALVPHDRQFEYYNGAGVEIAFMGAGEMDRFGNVNSTRMGSKTPGAGGFIDITTMAKTVVFCSTFTAQGLKVQFGERGVSILEEGKVKKLVKDVGQISYNGKMARERGQTMYFVTERAVFELRAEGPVLIEIAQGVDLERDILAQMEFAPIVADEIKQTPKALYADGPFGLGQFIQQNWGR